MKSARRTRRWAMGAAGAALFAMLGTAIVPAHGFAPSLAPADAAPRAPAPEPNILFILIDDMGFADLSLTGNKLVATPNIDALARGKAAGHKPGARPLRHLYRRPEAQPRLRPSI